MAVYVYSNLFHLLVRQMQGATFCRAPQASLVPVVAKQSKRVTAATDLLHPRADSEILMDVVYHDAWSGEECAKCGDSDSNEVSQPSVPATLPRPKRRRAG